MNEVVEQNLEKMTTHNKGNMPNLVLDESCGGNAGEWQSYPCAGANFFYDSITGKIMYFENIQSAPENIVENYPEHTFRLAVRFAKHRHGIIDYLRHLIRMRGEDTHTKYLIIDYTPPENASPAAQQNLEETVRIYNERYGFEP